MQQHREVAKYAKALYAIAEKKGLIEETLKNLKLLYSINLSSAKFHLFLKSRRIDIKIKKEIMWATSKLKPYALVNFLL